VTQEAKKHPNYVALWGILVAALLVSILLGEMKIPVLAVVLIFTVAVAKAYLVAAYYMHLRYEPLFIVIILLAGLVTLYVLFFGLVPDVVYPPLT
jgi:cytochrome c oxidase subunit 4